MPLADQRRRQPLTPLHRATTDVISFDQVTKRYPGGTIAVNQLTLTIPSRQITTLVGPSGCGKTTTLKMINRLIEPTDGRILIDGQDITATDAPQLRRRIGYVIQQGGLFPNKTVVDNITTVPRLLGTRTRVARRLALELLEVVGLSADLATRYPSQLSGGQQQRVGVARALAADPPILLMDEPFSAVDPIVRQQLQDELLRIQRELSKTIVFVTHDIDEAIKLGDEVVVMRVGGTLAQHATPAEILATPADSFVAAFVGKDRGYRALGFIPSGSLPLVSETCVTIGQTVADARDALDNGWVLITDRKHRPLGWLDRGTVDGAPADQRLTEDMLNLGGTLAMLSGSLREALDAALSSPSKRGVVINEDQTVAGTITAAAVLAHIESSAPSSPTADGVARSSAGSHAQPVAGPDDRLASLTTDSAALRGGHR